MAPTGYQPSQPCTTAYNHLMKFNTECGCEMFAAVDLPECSADGYYKAVQCDQNDCWCSTREGKEKVGTRQSKFNVRSRLTCSQSWYPTTTTGCSKCQTGVGNTPTNTNWFWQNFGTFGTTYQPGQITDTWIVGNPTIQQGFMQTGTQYFPVNSATAKADATSTSTGGGHAWSDASSSAEVIPSNTFLLGKK